jgi:hypothetical protein
MRVVTVKSLNELLDTFQYFTNELFLSLSKIELENSLIKSIVSPNNEVFVDLPFCYFSGKYEIKRGTDNKALLVVRSPVFPYDILSFIILPRKTKLLGYYKISVTSEKLIKYSDIVITDPVNMILYFGSTGTYFHISKESLGKIIIRYDRESDEYIFIVPIKNPEVIKVLEEYENSNQNDIRLTFLLKLCNVKNTEFENQSILKRGLTIVYEIKSGRDAIELYRKLNKDTIYGIVKDIFRDVIDIKVSVIDKPGRISISIKSIQNHFTDKYSFHTSVAIIFKMV